MAKTYRIYPGIGIARIGNSSKYFIGPESPHSSMSGPFKEQGLVKKQAARFRIYEFDVDSSGRETLVREVVASPSISIQWDVHLANKKAASRRVPIDDGRLRNPSYDQSKLVIEARDSITGTDVKNADMVGEIQFIRTGSTVVEGRDDVELGHLESDSDGHLLVVGGNGKTESPINKSMVNFANNPGWYDDCCDGPVNAILTIDGQAFEVEGAWVVVASPAYAPDIMNVVTWYDQARNVEASAHNPGILLETPSFTHEIYPILKRASQLKWVSAAANSGHGPSGGPTGKGNFLDQNVLSELSSKAQSSMQAKIDVFEKLMPPNTPAPYPNPELPPYGTPKNMPYLYSGMNPEDLTKLQYDSLTPLQYRQIQKWANGDFLDDWVEEPQEVQFEDIPLEEQPSALDKAALQACIGGPFFPGIESTYLMALPVTYSNPYRIDPAHGAGYMTQLMAVPWQADFHLCGAFWWPAQRPVSIETGSGRADFSRGINSYNDMRDNWSKLGFIVKDGDEYLEKERS